MFEQMLEQMLEQNAANRDWLPDACGPNSTITD